MTGRGRNKSGLTIRSFQASDRDALVRLWEACGLTTPWNDPDRDIALAATTESAELFVGEMEGEIRSSCLVGHDGHRGWLYYLATDPEHRGQGLGLGMVRHCEDWLRAREVPKVQLMIRETNLDAKAFYRKIGYGPNPCHLMQRWLVDRGAPKGISGGRPDGKLAYTVTYLEMTEPPTQPPQHPPRDCKVALLRAQRPTLTFYRFLYNAVGEPWLWWERRALDDAALKAILEDERVEVYVLYVDGVPAGFAELDRRQEPTIDLAYFGLLPDFIGRGLGPFLLTSVIDTAWSYEPEKLTVNTNTLDHPKALALYQKVGFMPTRRVDNLVDDPRLTGILPLS